MDQSNTSTVLDACINDFITHKRTLGRQFKTEEFILLAFRRFLQDDNAEDLDQGVFDRWCKHLSSLNANTRLSRQRILRNLCLYRQRHEPNCFVPNSLYFARSQPYRNPVMVEPEQIAILLEKTKTLPPSANSPLRGPVMRMAIVLLYTAGLRRGELVNIKLDDVDSRKGVIRICESKFYKSRLVPLSATARQELRAYLRSRERQGCPLHAESALLCNYRQGWRSYTGAGLRHGIINLIELCDVCDGHGRRPIVHDFRHNFAVQSLIRLYQRNEDVQSRLPHLALYMGHVSIASTAYYLHFIPTLAALASDRFEYCCGDVLQGVRNDS